jgi:transcription elongation factor Elf1
MPEVKLCGALRKCPACGSGDVSSTVEVEQFSYGKPGEEVEHHARYRVFSCHTCETSFADSDAEDAREAAIARLRALTKGSYQ